MYFIRFSSKVYSTAARLGRNALYLEGGKVRNSFLFHFMSTGAGVGVRGWSVLAFAFGMYWTSHAQTVF